ESAPGVRPAPIRFERIRPVKILVADGSIAFLDDVQSFLWDEGHDAAIAADGLECVALLDEFRPDLLVLDHELLWGGSEGVLARLDDGAKCRGLPVVLLWRERAGRDLQTSVNARIVAHLYKPLQLAELRAAVERHGRQHRIHGGLVGPI